MASYRITREQAKMLANLRDTHARTERDLAVAFTAILAGHGKETGDFAGIGGTPRKPTLEVSE